MGKHDKHHKRDRDDKHAGETDEERRARRLAKKATKRERETAALGGYSNESNPWNDPTLGDQFVWGKKVDRDRKMKPESAPVESQKRKRHEQVREVEKMKLARQLREEEKEAWEAEKVMIEREREQMAFYDNEKREEEFQLKQSHQRAHIRVSEGRGKPIDLVSESLSLLLDDIEAEAAAAIKPEDPLIIFHQLTSRELRELHAEICRRAQLDVRFADFWGAMRTLCEENEAALEAQQSGEDGAAGGAGLHSAVNKEVAGMLASKSSAELDELSEQIGEQLSGEATDVDYWQTVQRQLVLARARCVVRETYRHVLERKEELGAMAPQREAPPAPVETEHGIEESEDETKGDERDVGRYSPQLFDEDEDEEQEAGEGGAGGGAGGAGTIASGRFSPPLLQAHQVATERVVDEESDRIALQEERERVRQGVAVSGGGGRGAGGARSAGGSSGAPAEDAASSALVDAEARRGMEQGEARFSFEVPIERKVTWWHDKYKPRKPKYFNRVHTGYEWNKYNQTHFDHDNPPPKMVQGYKFAVFYPDLIDRTQTPTYVLEKDPNGARDTCILRFKGGAPYEDIAFKIVNNEWELSHKRGFKCRFERGILQLHFGFKRYRYRR